MQRKHTKSGAGAGPRGCEYDEGEARQNGELLSAQRTWGRTGDVAVKSRRGGCGRSFQTCALQTSICSEEYCPVRGGRQTGGRGKLNRRANGRLEPGGHAHLKGASTHQR